MNSVAASSAAPLGRFGTGSGPDASSSVWLANSWNRSRISTSVGRWAGVFASMRRSSASSAGGTAGAMTRTDGGGCDRCLPIMSSAFCDGNTRAPVNSS